MFVMCEMNTWMVWWSAWTNKNASKVMGVLVYIKIKICTMYNLLHFHCGFKTQKFHSVSGGEGCHNNAFIHLRANAERKTQACRKHTHTHAHAKWNTGGWQDSLWNLRCRKDLVCKCTCTGESARAATPPLLKHELWPFSYTSALSHPDKNKIKSAHLYAALTAFQVWASADCGWFWSEQPLVN